MKKFAQLFLYFVLMTSIALAAAPNQPEPVNGTISVTTLSKQATPVSGTISVQELRKAGTPVSGTISVQELRASATPVSGTVSVERLLSRTSGEPGTLLTTPLPLAITAPTPRMSPGLALDSYLVRQQRQAASLSAYTAQTVIEADLPQMQQHGRFELERSYSAPTSLKFKAVKYEGDGGVKSNVITRLLQSEVDHVTKGLSAQTALTPENYKFSYKSDDMIDGRPVHVYHVKPREKRAGLFKGSMALDVSSGSLVRAEGEVVKSPSFWVKKIEFVQDYDDFDGYTLPVHLHSVANARVYGKTVVEISNQGYHAEAVRTASNDTAVMRGN